MDAVQNKAIISWEFINLDLLLQSMAIWAGLLIVLGIKQI